MPGNRGAQVDEGASQFIDQRYSPLVDVLRVRSSEVMISITQIVQ